MHLWTEAYRRVEKLLYPLKVLLPVEEEDSLFLILWEEFNEEVCLPIQPADKRFTR